MRLDRCALCLAAGLLLAGGPVAQDLQTLQKANVGPDDDSLLTFFRRRAVRADPRRAGDLVRQLGARSFTAREAAARELTALGGLAVPELLRATRGRDAEVRRRAEACLQTIRAEADPPLVAAAARRLAARNPAGAAEALLDFLPAVVDDEAAEEVFGALAAVAVRDGRPSPALLRALSDEAPLRRAGAAVALCRARLAGPEPLAGVRPLLRDSDAQVRLHVALALTQRGEKAAVPVLIGAFEGLPRNQLWRAEDALYRLAGAHAPPAAPGEEASRRAFAAAWLAWWDARGKDVDLFAAGRDEYRDHTLVVLLDENRVVDLDADDKPYFQIDELAFPLDVEALPGERVLVAEHHGNRVTERLRDGTVLWEKRADEPLAAQRLAGGRTFIGCKGCLMEVDREGRQVFFHAQPQGEEFMRARKLPDGTYAAVVQGRDRQFAQHFVRLDAAGKELARFPVRVHTSGGRVDVQPDGRVLIPQLADDLVVEYDARGQRLRSFEVRGPIVAARLPGGNLMVTSMTEKRAVEIDLAGKRVWEYRANTRVTRAYRH